MAKLDGRFKGKLAHFVAFDPFRRKDALNSIDAGVRLGAIGVKVYPPSGYRATANQIPAQPPISQTSARSRWNSRYRDLRNNQLNTLLDDLFKYCVSADIPIFTHCSPGGFEAESRYGWMSDPQYWARALEKYPKLRLCFGHAGGDAYWFSKQTDPETKEAAFGRRIIDLCVNYQNVYCDVAYLDGVLNPQLASVFKERLVAAISRHSPNGQWSFGNKIMYGSDWHMLHKVEDHEKYVQAFQNIFADPKLQPWQRDFFAKNAVEYLRLSELSHDLRFSEDERKYWENLVRRSAAISGFQGSPTQ